MAACEFKDLSIILTIGEVALIITSRIDYQRSLPN